MPKPQMTAIERAQAAAANEAKLPEVCYAIHMESGNTIVLKRGEIGFHDPQYGVQGEEAVNRLNERMGVTRQQRAAMEAGSIFGYHLPIADPDRYDSLGNRL